MFSIEAKQKDGQYKHCTVNTDITVGQVVDILKEPRKVWETFLPIWRKKKGEMYCKNENVNLLSRKSGRLNCYKGYKDKYGAGDTVIKYRRKDTDSWVAIDNSTLEDTAFNYDFFIETVLTDECKARLAKEKAEEEAENAERLKTDLIITFSVLGGFAALVLSRITYVQIRKKLREKRNNPS